MTFCQKNKKWTVNSDWCLKLMLFGVRPGGAEQLLISGPNIHLFIAFLLQMGGFSEVLRRCIISLPSTKGRKQRPSPSTRRQVC